MRGDAADPSSRPPRIPCSAKPSLSSVAASVHVRGDLSGLPDALITFLEAAAARNFFRGLPAMRALLEHSGPSEDAPRIFVAEHEGRPLAALFCRERHGAGRLKTHMLLGPSHWMYAAHFGPILDPDHGEVGLAAIALAIARTSPRFHVLRFDALDHGTAAALRSAFRKAGMAVQPFLSYQNFYEEIPGLGAGAYLAMRDPGVRRRATRAAQRLTRSGRARFALVSAGGPRVAAALLDFAMVDLQSRKEPEHYPDCVPELARAAAAAGTLRLGLCYIDGVPAAAQIWIAQNGKARLLRLCHAEGYARLSPGTALTIEMLRHLIDVDRVGEIDFGPGGDRFKADWALRHRACGGLMIFNLRTAKGLLAASWHIGGHAALALARRLRGLLRRCLGGR